MQIHILCIPIKKYLGIYIYMRGHQLCVDVVVACQDHRTSEHNTAKGAILSSLANIPCCFCHCLADGATFLGKLLLGPAGVNLHEQRDSDCVGQE